MQLHHSRSRRRRANDNLLIAEEHPFGREKRNLQVNSDSTIFIETSVRTTFEIERFEPEMSIFFAPQIEKDKVLPESESSHAVKVLRMKEGDALQIVDGKGNFFEANISVANSKHCEVILHRKIGEYGKRRMHLHIAIAPTKNIDRIEWFAEKATEIGIEEITPIICRFSERKVLNLDRIEKILVSAMKQSQKAYLPILNPCCAFEHFLNQQHNGQLFIGHCYEGAKMLLATSYKAGNDATFLIGPEGDFSQEEVKAATEKGFVPISLGESRLRTETAGIVACDTFNIINEIGHLPNKISDR